MDRQRWVRLEGRALRSRAPASNVYASPLQWLDKAGDRTPRARIRYRGRLARDGRRLVLHHGYDGWARPVRDAGFERVDDRSWVVEIETEGHAMVDCIVRDEDSDRTDNNDGADYRLWVAVDPVDSHVHTKDHSAGSMGSRSLVTALSSAGMTHAVVSWADNEFVDLVVAAMPWLTPLVWVRPAYSDVEDVQKRLAAGFAGLKLHPAYDNYPADSRILDPFLRAAADAGVPVTVHSGPGPADPTLIRRLAERFPTVPFVLYHTYLGHPEGRYRAGRHARQVANLHLETSWCSSIEVERLIGEVGPDQVLFGSDAAIDGPLHFVRQPPNVELMETYNQGLVRLARRLSPEVFRQLVETNTRSLFGMPAQAAAVPHESDHDGT